MQWLPAATSPLCTRVCRSLMMRHEFRALRMGNEQRIVRRLTTSEVNERMLYALDVGGSKFSVITHMHYVGTDTFFLSLL